MISNADLLRLLSEANMSLSDLHLGRITKFAKLVQAAAVKATAEECAKECEAVARHCQKHLGFAELNTARDCYKAIVTKYELLQ